MEILNLKNNNENFKNSSASEFNAAYTERISELNKIRKYLVH